MKICLGPRFSLSLFFDQSFCYPVSVIQSIICCRSASDKRSRLEVLLPSSIKPNEICVSLLNGKIRGTDKEEDALPVFEKGREEERKIDCTSAIFRGYEGE